MWIEQIKIDARGSAISVNPKYFEINTCQAHDTFKPKTNSKQAKHITITHRVQQQRTSIHWNIVNRLHRAQRTVAKSYIIGFRLLLLAINMVRTRERLPYRRASRTVGTRLSYVPNSSNEFRTYVTILCAYGTVCDARLPRDECVRLYYLLKLLEFDYHWLI